MSRSRLASPAIRRSEDAWVDALLEGAEKLGIATLCARYARAYLDVNREPHELDPTMFEGEPPPFALAQTARVAAGLGAIARVVGEGQEIYTGKLSFSEAQARIEDIHRPYHHALSALMAESWRAWGRAALIDWHSMPSAASRPRRRGRSADIVLGDRFGASCAPALTALVERELRKMGYEVARNAPYAGGYVTETYGDPARGAHVLQVEINRALYMDEAEVRLSAGFDQLKADLRRLSTVLAERWREVI